MGFGMLYVQTTCCKYVEIIMACVDVTCAIYHVERYLLCLNKHIHPACDHYIDVCRTA